MTTQDLGLFKALSARMDYINQRHKVISQNIANADTPGYRPRDLDPVDFGSMIGHAKTPASSPAVTNPRHIGGANAVTSFKAREQSSTYETSPVGNAVIIEEQMVKSSQNMMDYNITTALYQKNLNLLRMAVGRGG